MDDSAKLASLRDMVGGGEQEITYSDAVLSAYLRIAGRKIINRAFPYRDDITEVPGKYESVQLEVAAYLVNKRGAEGETSHGENGITRTYENADVPESMLRAVVPACGVV